MSKNIKLVIWDADNTLWNGSAYYTDKNMIRIKPGSKAALKELDKKGVINVLCSKNNYQDIDVILKRFSIDKYFKNLQIGWGLKSEAIKKIAKLFSLSFRDMLFIDDDPFQRAEVFSQIPELNVIDLVDPIDILNIEGIKLDNQTVEDKKRVQILKEARSREEAEKNHQGSYKDFLRQCDIEMFIRGAKRTDWPRVIQLLNRTNELNATGNRYALEELKKMHQTNKNKIFVAELKDKFGDYGLIVEAIINIDENDVWFIRDLTVSCRTMGRGIGSAMVLAILNLAKKDGLKTVCGHVIPTESNWRMQSLFEKRGFKMTSDSGKIKEYKFDLKNQIISYPDWLKIIICI